MSLELFNNFREAIKDGGIAIAVIVLIAYACGWEYYISLLHSYDNFGVYILIPWEKAIGQGLETMFTLFLPVLVFFSIGYLIGKTNKISTSNMELRLLGVFTLWILIPIILLAITFLLYLNKVVKVGGFNIHVYSVYVPILITMLFAVSCPIFMVLPKIDAALKPISFYSVAVLFIFTSGLHSHYLGSILKDNIATKKSRATILFSDEKVQKEYGEKCFAPIIAIENEIICVMFDAAASQDGELIIIKKELVKTMTFSIKPSP